MSKETITLDNFAEWDGEVHGVEIQSALPLEKYVPGPEITVNIGRIARIARVSRLETLSFRGYSERESISVGVSSLNEDGSATATLSASAAVSRTDSLVQSTPLFPMPERGRGGIRINFSHPDLNDVNLRDARPWANHLDSSIKEGLRNCANKQLFSNYGPWRALGLAIDRTSWGGLVALSGPSDIKTLIGTSIGAQVLTTLGYNALGRSQREDPEYSLVPYLPLDRLALAHFGTRGRKLVKAGSG